MTDKLDYPATGRNREPLLEVLQRVLPARGTLLEISAGSGQHAAFFAPPFPDLVWHPTDLEPDALRSIDAWAAGSGASNLRAAQRLDVTAWPWPLDAADVVLNVNLRGTFFCAQAAAAHMVAQGYGRIINVASQLAVSSAPGRAAYVASKGGIVSLTQTLALEWVRDGVTVNAIGPGPTSTPLTANSTPENEAAILARSPLGRRQTPEEIAGSVVFLASDAANTITGHHLLIDGGWTAG